MVTFAKTGYSGVAAGREGVQDVPIWGTGELEAPMGCPGEGGAGKSGAPFEPQWHSGGGDVTGPPKECAK